MTGLENTKNLEVLDKIRDSYNTLSKIDYFSKHEFSFKLDLFDLRSLISLVSREGHRKKSSHDSSFVENEEDSDLFSEKQESEASRTKLEAMLHGKQAGGSGAHYDTAVSADDKAAIIQDWLFQGYQCLSRWNSLHRLERPH